MILVCLEAATAWQTRLTTVPRDGGQFPLRTDGTRPPVFCQFVSDACGRSLQYRGDRDRGVVLNRFAALDVVLDAGEEHLPAALEATA